MKQLLFFLYLALLCWIPVPLASKSLLAQDIFILWTTLLALGCCLESTRKNYRVSPALRNAWVPCLLFALTLSWLLVQTLHIPLQWIEMLSPQRARYLNDITGPATLSFNPWATGHTLLLGFAYLELFVITLLLVNSESRLRTLLYTVVVLGVLQALYGSLMTLSGMEKQLWFDKEAHRGFATGTLLNRNHFANYLTYSAAAAIGLLLASTRFNSQGGWREVLRALLQWLLGSKGWLRAALVILVTALILTRSRMGNVAFFASLTTTALLWLWLSGKLNRTTLVLFISLFVIDALLVGMWFGIDEVTERLENSLTETELRYQMLPYLQLLASDFWVAGSGGGTFADLFPLYKGDITRHWYNEAHFDYLQFLIEFGVIGSLPLAGLVLLSLCVTLLTIHRRRSHLPQAAGFSVLMALTASGIHALVEYNLQRPATTTLFVVFLALPWVLAHLPSQHHRHHQQGR